MRPLAKRLLSVLGVCALFAIGVAADSIPVEIRGPNLKVTTVLSSGITQPIGIVFLSQNDFFVLEKASGRVKRVINGVIEATPVLDLAVNSNSETRALEPGAAKERAYASFCPFFPQQSARLYVRQFLRHSAEMH